MDNLLSHKTALRLLRDPELELVERSTNSSSFFAPGRPVDAFTVRDCLSEHSALRRAGEPLEFVTSDHGGARHQASYISHVFGSPLPAGSVFQLRRGLWCCGPELTALQLATCLSELELVVVLCESMGTYSLAPGRDGGLV